MPIHAQISFFIDLPLPVDQIGGHVHQIQNAVDGFVPVSQEVLFVFDWFEVDDSVDAVDSAWNGFVVVQGAELLLAVFLLDFE